VHLFRPEGRDSSPDTTRGECKVEKRIRIKTFIRGKLVTKRDTHNRTEGDYHIYISTMILCGMKHSPLSEADRRSVSYETPRFYRNPNAPTIAFQWFLSGPDEFSPHPRTLPHYDPFNVRLGLPSGLFLQSVRQKFCVHFSYLPCILHSPPMSSFI
jgi:hypothetical protein